MAALTQLLNLTQLLRLAWAGSDAGAVGPSPDAPFELVTQDGIYLVTEDGNYIGVAYLGPVLLWSAQALFWGDEPLTWSSV
jgi:hypothetical protein